MKHTKQIIAAVIAVTIVTALIPLLFRAKAATNGVQKKLDELRAVYSTGTYFTADGNVCYSNQCDNCRLSKIPSRGGLPSGAEVQQQLRNESWSCRSFADYAFYYIFGEAYWNLPKSDSAVLGDFIKLNNGRHSAIYLWEDANYYYVYDSNGDSCNSVYYNRAFSKASWRISGIYHAKSYDKVMNGGSAAVVKDLAEGSYFISSAQSGLYISSVAPSEGKAVYALTDLHSETVTAKIKRSEAAAFLTIPVGVASTSGWTFEVVGGGYVIRSATQPSKALTANEDGAVTLADYAGSSAQLWKIEEAYHNTVVSFASEATCTAQGEAVYVCKDCDYTYTVYQPEKPHVYTVETVEPGENSYGFTKYKCVNCGCVMRKDVQEKLNADALIDTGEILQREDGYVYVSTDITEEALMDAFPGYEASGNPVTSTGKTLAPAGVDSVPDKAVLTVILPGDVDGDGSVTAMDARIILRSCVNLDQITDEVVRRAADIDFDGKVTSEDARWILRTAVGYETGATTLAGIDAA